jgi:hypothetical protein
MAMLDAILSPKWQYRYYRFDAGWGPGMELASMDNGSGDAYSIVFSVAGAYVRVFDHESPMSPWAQEPPRPWPGVLDAVPAAFRALTQEPSFTHIDDVQEVTACLWRERDDVGWHAGPVAFPEGYDDPDGSGWLLELLLDSTPAAFQRYAEDYYERPVDVAAVERVYALEPLTGELVAMLNPKATMAKLARDLAGIGYPQADQLHSSRWPGARDGV